MPISSRLLRPLFLLLSCALTACTSEAGPRPAEGHVTGDHRADDLVEATSPIAPFQVDPEKPFHLEFGRGSGWHGLSVVILDESGRAILSREPHNKDENWSTSELTLPHALVREIVAAINSENLTSLNHSYTGHVADGTQWVFLLTQGQNSKSVYFDNNFPSPIKNFATTLDNILNRAGLAQATWQPGGRELDKPLWKSIEQTK